MKKVLLFLLGLVMVAPAFADVRDMGMGIRADQENGIDNVFDFPNLINNYKLVDLRMGFVGPDDNWGGIVRKDDYIGNWGLYINRPVQNGYGYTPWDFVNAQYNGILDGSQSWGNLVGSNPVNNGGSVYGNLGATFTSVGFNGPGSEILTPERKFDLLKSFKAGNGVLGVRVEYGANKGDGSSSALTDPTLAGNDDTSAQQKLSSSFYGVQAGYGLDKLGPFSHVDIGLGYTVGSVDNSMDRLTYNGQYERHVTLKGDGIGSARVKLRAMKDTSENNTWVFNGGVRLDKLAVVRDRQIDYNSDGDFTDSGETVKYSSTYKDTNINLGVNMNQKVHDGKGLAIVGLTLLSDKMSRSQDSRYNGVNSAVADQYGTPNAKDTWEQSYLGVYANIGVEAQLLSWLQFRGGIAKALVGATDYKITDTYALNPDGSGEAKTVYENKIDTPSGVTSTFGVGMTFKNWQIDMLTTSSDVENFLTSPVPGDGVFMSNKGRIIQFYQLDLKYML